METPLGGPGGALEVGGAAFKEALPQDFVVRSKAPQSRVVLGVGSSASATALVSDAALTLCKGVALHLADAGELSDAAGALRLLVRRPDGFVVTMGTQEAATQAVRMDTTGVRVAGDIGATGDVRAVGDVHAATLHTSHGVVNTSDARGKEQIRPCHLGLEFVGCLRPVCYRMHGADHAGLLAQDVRDALAATGADTSQSAMWRLSDPSDLTSPQQICYTQLIAPLVVAIQELQARLQAVEHQAGVCKQRRRGGRSGLGFLRLVTRLTTRH
jgi:hypothetical protein